MILTLASLLVLQLLSSISCRSLRVDESEKGKAGHVAHLLVPYHGSDGHKEDREIKVRLVPFKDDGSSKKHIAIHVTNPKQKTENLPVAIIVDSQGHKKGVGSKKEVPHTRKAKKIALEGKRVKSRANEEPNRKKKSDESASVSNSVEGDEGKRKVRGGSKHERFSQSESGELWKKKTEESSSDSDSGESGELRKKESKESSSSVSNSDEGKRKVRGGSKQRVSKSESGELRKKETEESSSDSDSGENGELRKKESKESSSDSNSDDSNDTSKNDNESKKYKSSSESQSDDSNESVQVDKRHSETPEELTPNLREIIDSKMVIDTEFSDYNSDDESYESSAQNKELTDDTSSGGSSSSSSSSTDDSTRDTSDSVTYDGLDNNQEWKEIINEHQLFTINDSFESSGADTKESLSEVIDALIKVFSGEVGEQTSQEDTKESSSIDTSDEESKEVSKSDKSSSKEDSAQSQSVEARKLQYITVETQSDEASKALREAESESSETSETSETSENKESTRILDSEEIEKLLHLLHVKEHDPSEESQTEETDSDGSESENPTTSDSEEHKERRKIKKKKETQCSSESTGKINEEELTGELKKVEKHIIEAIASYFDTQDKEAKEEGKAYNLSFLFNKK